MLLILFVYSLAHISLLDIVRGGSSITRMVSALVMSPLDSLSRLVFVWDVRQGFLT